MLRKAWPDWAERERIPDMAWIGENLHVFWTAAQQQYRGQGRGAIVVDTTEQPIAGAGHPFAYLDQAQIHEVGYADAARMVQAYAPDQEIVVVLLKSERRISVYRLQSLSAGRGEEQR